MNARRSAENDGPSSAFDIDPLLLSAVQLYLANRGLRSDRDPLRDAWRKFYELYDPLIRRLATTAGAKATEVSDCVQEVWLALIEHLETFHPESRRGRFTTWLYAVVRSKVIDGVRRRIRQSTDRLTDKNSAGLSSRFDHPADDGELQRQRTLLLDGLARIRATTSEHQYNVLYLRSVEGRSVKEIAADLRATPAQVRVWHHRGKRSLQALLVMHPDQDNGRHRPCFTLAVGQTPANQPDSHGLSWDS